MQGQSDERERNRDLWLVERAIVLQVLRDDHEERWLRAELAQELSDFELSVLDEGLAQLEREGILHQEGTSVWAARAARHLDELELISI